MGFRDPLEDATKTLVHQTRLFFEPHLADLQLSKPAIMGQDQEELQLSLATLDTLIGHPEQFGLFKFSIAVKSGALISVVADSPNMAQFEIGILPLLLSRKRLVLDRLRELKGARGVQTLVDLVEQVSDEASREALRAELSSLRKQISDLAAQAGDLGQEAEAASKDEFEEIKKRIAGERAGIFLVHGHDSALKFELARFLERVTNEKITILAEEPNRGRTVVEKLEQYSHVKFAVILLTPDDRVLASGKEESRARQNVILELGLFIALLGRDNVCVLYKQGTEIPSDYSGILLIEADSRGGWKLPLLRELQEADISVEWAQA
jgi:predicted nucleotide-binding protein